MMLSSLVPGLALLFICGLLNIGRSKATCMNVASLSKGARCEASSEFSDFFACEKALDGITAATSSEWATNGEGVGAWLEIEFQDIYEIEEIRFMPKNGLIERFRMLQLTFDGNIQKKVTMSDGGTGECIDIEWEEFPISNICSRKVRIEALSVHTTTNNGFLEVEVHSARSCLGKNIAGSRMGATCTASTEYDGDYKCEKAMDGLAREGSRPQDWATLGEGAGAWILITFGDVYDVRRARFMQRPYASGQFKDLRLVFDGGASQEITLTSGTGALLWDEFDLEPVCSSTVRINVLTAYNVDNNGFREIEFYATHLNCQCSNQNAPMLDEPRAAQ